MQPRKCLEKSNDIIFENDEPHQKRYKNIMMFSDKYLRNSKTFKSLEYNGNSQTTNPIPWLYNLYLMIVNIMTCCVVVYNYLSSSNIPTSHADDIYWKCGFQTPNDVVGETAEELQMTSFFHYKIASFSGTDRGYFGALVSEVPETTVAVCIPWFLGYKFSLLDKLRGKVSWCWSPNFCWHYEPPIITTCRTGITNTCYHLVL